MPRRLAYVPYGSWWPLLVIEEIGIFVDIAALLAFIWQITVSIRDRHVNRAGQDPWGTARSLEWLTHSPVPVYNFAVIPHINARDEWAWRREHHLDQVMPAQYENIELPLNTPVPMLIGFCTAAFGFAMIWRIWWLAIGSLAAIFAIVIFRSFGDGAGTTLRGSEVRRMEMLAMRPPARPKTGPLIPGVVTAFTPGAAE